MPLSTACHSLSKNVWLCLYAVRQTKLGSDSIQILHVDMDNVLCAYGEAFTAAKVANPDVRFPQGKIGFFRNLPPIDGAIEAVNRLRERFQVYVLTAPSVRNPHSYSEKRLWIEDHFDYQMAERLIISPDKGLVHGDFLIDDMAKGRGQDRFQGELIQFGTHAFRDWKLVLDYLLALE